MVHGIMWERDREKEGRGNPETGEENVFVPVQKWLSIYVKCANPTTVGIAVFIYVYCVYRVIQTNRVDRVELGCGGPLMGLTLPSHTLALPLPASPSPRWTEYSKPRKQVPKRRTNLPSPPPPYGRTPPISTKADALKPLASIRK
jgi:hypothetical protein